MEGGERAATTEVVRGDLPRDDRVSSGGAERAGAGEFLAAPVLRSQPLGQRQGAAEDRLYALQPGQGGAMRVTGGLVVVELAVV